MSAILSFENPLEFILRYTVITGIILAIIGLSIYLLAKRITMAVRKQDVLDKNDKLYKSLVLVGLILILVGMIVMALPINNTFYKL